MEGDGFLLYGFLLYVLACAWGPRSEGKPVSLSMLTAGREIGLHAIQTSPYLSCFTCICIDPWHAGDLGANCMGLVEGKSQLYTTAGGVDPGFVMPVCIDVGTNNEGLRNDPEYKVLRRGRPASADDYDGFMDRVMEAMDEWRPHLLIHFEVGLPACLLLRANDRCNA